MDFKKILIVPKMTKYEFDMHRYELSSKELIEKYKKENVNIDKIMESHYRQKGALEKLREIFNESKFISRNELSEELVEEFDLVISFGGDNHFTYVSRFVNGKPILGINSDPLRSEGALVYFSSNELDELAEILSNDNFEIEIWPLLKANLNDNEEMIAISELFIGENKRDQISRNIIEFNGIKEDQKGSGLIISTGAGSTGWYNSASRYLFAKGNVFDKTENKAVFIVSEPHEGRLTKSNLLHGELMPGEEIIIYSQNDDNGIINADSLKKLSFPRGSKVKIHLADIKLKVVKKR